MASSIRWPSWLIAWPMLASCESDKEARGAMQELESRERLTTRLESSADEIQKSMSMYGEDLQLPQPSPSDPSGPASPIAPRLGCIRPVACLE